GNMNNVKAYYSRVSDHQAVDKATRHLARIFLNQVDSNHTPIIYLDPGHGKQDPGSIAGNIFEKDLNLQVSNYLINKLEKMGYIVITSRTTDIFVELFDRAVDANDVNADVFVSIHHNSMGGSGTAKGIETFIHHTVSSGFGQETNKNNWKMDDPR